MQKAYHDTPQSALFLDCFLKKKTTFKEYSGQQCSKRKYVDNKKKCINLCRWYNLLFYAHTMLPATLSLMFHALMLSFVYCLLSLESFKASFSCNISLSDCYISHGALLCVFLTGSFSSLGFLLLTRL